MKRLLIVAAFFGGVLPVVAPAATVLNTDGALFGIRETVEDIDLSPDGNQVAYVTPGPGRTTLVLVADLAGGTPKTILQSDGHPEHIDWCNFVTNKRLICQFTGVSTTNGVLIDFSRLIAVDNDGKNAAPLGQRKSNYDASIRQNDGEILDWLPDADGAVLMERVYVPEEAKMNTLIVKHDKGLGIDRIDLATMKSTRVEAPAEAVDRYMSDGHGHVRIKGNQAQHGVYGDLASIVTYNFRLPGSKEWLPFSNWDDQRREGMVPVAVDAESNSAYVLKKLDGRLALYRVTLDGSMATELVYKNGKVDVDDVVRVRHGSRVIGVTFAEEKRSAIYFDPEYGGLSGALGKALPNLPKINFAGASADNNKLLIAASSDSDPGRYYVFDKVKHTLNEILLVRPTLEQTKLASVKAITYSASDGTAIPAYLTLPPGMESARGLPAVVLPHGGPSSRDVWGFDWLAQFLAHEGYAVLQPNNRGSDGFGDAWLQENGFKSWKTSIGDVTAAGRWLVAQGIADPKRLAIVGWSYGGYAALQSGVTDPGMFKAIVAIAPVTDLALLKREELKYISARLVADEVGAGPHVAEGSPLQNVAKITSPVLIFHGDQDLNVNVEQSQKMDAKLHEAGKSSELVVYAGLEHSLPDSNVRAQMLDKIAAFLKANTTAK